MAKTVHILAYEEPIFHKEFFERILTSTPPQYVVSGVTIVKQKTDWFSNMKYVYNMGGLSGFFLLGVRVAFKMAESILRNQTKNIRQLFEQHHIPVDIQEYFDQGLIAEKMKDKRPDFIFCAIPNILKKKLLSLPKIACINRHAGKLPEYRGVEPVFYAMLNGEPDVVVTYHTMTEKIDCGMVLWEHREKVQERDSVFRVYDRLFKYSANGFWNAIDASESGRSLKAETGSGKYYKTPTSNHVAKFKSLGYKYI